jgi:hypothetical protein
MSALRARSLVLRLVAHRGSSASVGVVLGVVLPVVLGVVLLLGVVGGCPAPATLNLGISAEEHTAAYFPITGDAPHALGASTVSGPMSCGSCHGGTASFTIAKCIECHQNDAVPTTTVHAGIAGFLPANSACLSCHADGTRGAEQGVDDHSRDQFPIDDDDVHGGPAYKARMPVGATTCTACHASVSDRTIVRCAECHASDATPLSDTHASPPVARSFEVDSTACKECHVATPVPAAMHPDNHPGYDMDHHDAVCSSCHQRYQALPKFWAVDFTFASCTGCHTHPDGCSPSSIVPCLSPPSP